MSTSNADAAAVPQAVQDQIFSDLFSPTTQLIAGGSVLPDGRQLFNYTDGSRVTFSRDTTSAVLFRPGLAPHTSNYRGDDTNGTVINLHPDVDFDAQGNRISHAQFATLQIGNRTKPDEYLSAERQSHVRRAQKALAAAFAAPKPAWIRAFN